MAKSRNGKSKTKGIGLLSPLSILALCFLLPAISVLPWIGCGGASSSPWGDEDAVEQEGERSDYSDHLDHTESEQTESVWEIESVDFEVPVGPLPAFEPALKEQGLQDEENYFADILISNLKETAGVDLILLRRNQSYEVHSGRGSIQFERKLADDRIHFSFPITQLSGERNPIERQDGVSLNSVDAIRVVSANPDQTDYQELGYEEQDPRVVFLDPGKTIYPDAYRRIAALFDHPNAPDLYVVSAPYGLAYEEFPERIGVAGGLHIVQSRLPLLIKGPGLTPKIYEDSPPPCEALAPTLAYWLDLNTREGYDRIGRRSTTRLLPFEDGGRLDPLLSEMADNHIRRLLGLIVSGLSHPVLMHALENEELNLPNLRTYHAQAAGFRYGLIAPFPSAKLTTQATLMTGAHPGHHGVLHDRYLDRETWEMVQPERDLAADPASWAPVLGNTGVETLFEALHRSRGRWSSTGRGAFSAALQLMVRRGAELATYIVEGSENLPGPLDLTGLEMELPGVPEEWTEEDLLIALATDNAQTAMLIQLMTGEQNLPVPELAVLGLQSYHTAATLYGPLSDQAMQALELIDVQLGLMMRYVEQAGINDETGWVLTSDSALELQDRSRSVDPVSAMNGQQEHIEGWSGGLWLDHLILEGLPSRLTEGQTVTLSVRARRESESRVPPGTVIVMADNDEEYEKFAMPDQLMTFTITPTGNYVTVLATTPGYGPTRKRIVIDP